MGNLLRISPIDLKTHNGKVNIYTMSVVGSAMDEEETLFSMWNEIGVLKVSCFVEVIFIINTLLLKILSINFLMPEVVCEAVLQIE